MLLIAKGNPKVKFANILWILSVEEINRMRVFGDAPNASFSKLLED
jgi:hypothetical protein